ncbi:MAG: hypothetical protein Q8O26_02475 [Phreatobacter sp.]|uniref:hypothetical protein n=1 Tax=Phreatobacter sp. TaxID=1966341 RepID=UPI0027371AAF|nr:hypothetical protein [Phreatobacter sp.]MDP2800726.1 hypothetical protein [Phreatobacter sp.]
MTTFDQKRLIDAPLAASALNASCRIWRSPRNHRMGGLVCFSGRYRPGSERSDDARFIRRTLMAFYEDCPVDGIVIDCRHLDYGWGDDLDLPNRSMFRERQIPSSSLSMPCSRLPTATPFPATSTVMTPMRP